METIEKGLFKPPFTDQTIEIGLFKPPFTDQTIEIRLFKPPFTDQTIEIGLFKPPFTDQTIEIRLFKPPFTDQTIEIGLFKPPFTDQTIEIGLFKPPFTDQTIEIGLFKPPFTDQTIEIGLFKPPFTDQTIGKGLFKPPFTDQTIGIGLFKPPFTDQTIEIGLFKPPFTDQTIEKGLDVNSLLNNPIPSNMKSEAKKAAKILRHFTEISSRTGPDKLIPANILANGQGLAIITVVKAGFMITAWGSRGIVIARLADGRSSSFSSLFGIGSSMQLEGLEVSDLVVILMHRRAVYSFSKGGNLTLGVKCTVSVGPMGRNVEVDIALRSTAAVFTYCKSRGLFAGVSLEGPCLIEHKDTNHNPPARARAPAAQRPAGTETCRHRDLQAQRPAGTETCSRETCRHRDLQHRDLQYIQWYAWPVVVPAIHPFTGRHPSDLSFNPSNRIAVVPKTELQYDWWEGMLNGRTGIFPANFLSYP
eukprot:XP_014067059.1 PREDICTED: SH3 domain-containing YSC84-like protein 1 [Salmo salar]